MLSVYQTRELGTHLVKQMDVFGSIIKKDCAKMTEPKFSPFTCSEWIFLSCMRRTMSFLGSILFFFSQLPKLL